jgi:NADP-dependent 3-hydroxy acid dehydrogenase YdfG|tara:strand:- start:180 stop:950 length:771 start_codon:yes stop_codon:yes gene_type:complete
MRTQIDMADKIAIVTGAGSGIGKLSALALAKDGWKVAVAGRRPDPLTETVLEIESVGGKGLAVQTDVSDPASVDALIGETVDTFGRLDLLFNNAGVGSPRKELEDLTDEDWNTVVSINLTGSFLCLRAAFRVMKDQAPQGGRIINNGSVSAQVPRVNSAPYTATKHAVTGLTRAASLDGRKYNIAVGQIDIGNAKVERTERTSVGMPQAWGVTEPEAQMDTQDVANTIVHMSSLPLDTNIQFMTIMATTMPYIGRG